MHWSDYEKMVKSSRDIIVIPKLNEYICKESGTGADIGCGDGYIASELVARNEKIDVIGFDFDLGLINQGRKKYNKKIRYIFGDITRHIVRKAGIEFDFAFSNCVLNRLNDLGVENLLSDLSSLMKNDSLFIILVPHWQRAEKYYRDVQYSSVGLTAIPDYGKRQSFRNGEWYCKKLVDFGFEVQLHDDVLVPNDSKLSERYKKCIGESIFTLIVAKLNVNSIKIKILSETFKCAQENRKFEIDMFWKRSLFYWGFIAASFVGYATSDAKNNNSLLFLLFGFLCSLVWAAGNRGSKYWQQYWERKVILFQNFAVNDVFIDHSPIKESFLKEFAARRISVSKLIIGISDYCVLVWAVLIGFKLFMQFYIIDSAIFRDLIIASTLLSIAFGVYLIIACKTKDNE